MLTFLIVVVVTAFLWVILGSTAPVSAADASWNGASIEYEGDSYLYVGESKKGESHKLPEGSKYYLSTKKTVNGTVTTYKAYVIYFASGVDPPVATSATRVSYDYDLATKTYSNPSQSQTITVIASTAGTTTNSCAVDDVGWIVCGISNFLATGMDFLFDKLSGFMEVQPLQTGTTDNGIYLAWNIMRGIANVAFIIVFLIIIYSQLTNMSVSNYGLKKLIPRLIVAAILVNLSYVIASLAVDVSNILGYSLQDIFMQIREDVFHVGPMTSGDMTSWESITGFVLSGGTAVAAGTLGAVAAIGSTGGTIVGAIYLILPLLIGLLLAVLTVLIVLAARQALIVILIILGPLAFVAYLLPNTEKWFKKWQDTLTTMLIFFPAFSVVFGGSQLAGAVIISNASSLTMLILGMAVQVAPLVITPLILKFSGSLIGKVAGLVNNPNKGLLDRTRKWSEGNREYHRQRGVSGMGKRKWLKPRDMLRQGKLWTNDKEAVKELTGKNFARNAARRLDQRKRRLDDRTKNASAHADNAYHRSHQYERIHRAAHEIGVDKQGIEDRHAEHINRETSTVGSKLYSKNIALEQGKRALEQSKVAVEQSVFNVQNDKTSQLHVQNASFERAKLDLDRAKMESQKIINEYRSGKAVIDAGNPNAGELSRIASTMSSTSIQLAAETRADVAAKREQQQAYAEALKSDAALREQAGGIDTDNGAQRALAEALSIISKNAQENVDNTKAILTYNNLTDKQKQELMNGSDITTASGSVIKASVDSIKASAELLLAQGSPGIVLDALYNANYDNFSKEDKVDIFATISDALKTGKMRPSYVDFGSLAKMAQGKDPNGNDITGAYGQDTIQGLALTGIEKSTLKTSDMQDMYTDYVKVINSALDNKAKTGAIDTKAFEVFQKRLTLLLDPEREGYDKLGDSELVYREIKEKVDAILQSR